MPEIGSTHSCRLQTVALMAPSCSVGCGGRQGADLSHPCTKGPGRRPQILTPLGISLPLGPSPASFPDSKSSHDLGTVWSTALSLLPGINQTLSKYLLAKGVNSLAPAYLTSSISCLPLLLIFSELPLVPNMQHTPLFFVLPLYILPPLLGTLSSTSSWLNPYSL